LIDYAVSCTYMVRDEIVSIWYLNSSWQPIPYRLHKLNF